MHLIPKKRIKPGALRDISPDVFAHSTGSPDTGAFAPKLIATTVPVASVISPENRFLSDEDVWRAFQNGEDAAFNMLYTRYSDRLYAYLKFLLVASPRHLDDIFQEAWITVFRQRAEFEALTASSFSSWLFRVGHNLAISQVRKDPKTIGIDDLDMDSDLIEGFVVQAVQDNYDAPNAEEIMRHVSHAVEELPILLREVFVLSEFDHLSLEQIADALGISRSNAKVRLFRARRVIRERLEKVLDI